MAYGHSIREIDMLFRNALSPREVALLRAVLQEHCSAHGITSEEAGTSVASSLLVYYRNGIRDRRRLLAALDQEELLPANGLAVRAVPLPATRDKTFASP